MSKKKAKIILKFLSVCSVLTFLLFPLFSKFAEAQSGGVVAASWNFEEVITSGTSVITPDATGVNPGVLVGEAGKPILVEGEFGKALQFDGNNTVYVPIKFVIGFPPTPEPVFMPISTNLDIQEQIKISARVNVPLVRHATYNNIAIKCTHPDQACAWQNTIRVNGLAIRGEYLPEEGNQAYGAVSGFVFTDSGGFSEIVTMETVPLNEWVNIEFTRTSTGMHLYIDGFEQNVNVIHGVQNPQGKILNGTEYYIGHDSVAIIEDVQIVDLSPPVAIEAAFDIGPNIMIAVIIVTLVFAIAWVLRRAIQLWLIRSKL